MGHDHPEIKRLQQQHLWLRSDMPDLVLAPIDKKKPNQKVIDSGTADGMSHRLLCTSGLSTSSLC